MENKTTSTKESVAHLQKQTAELPTDEFLKFVWNHFGDKIALASSLSAEDQVITHILCGITGHPRIFTLDTGRLPQKIYDVIEAIYKKYNLRIKMLFPDAQAVEQMVNKDGRISFTIALKLVSNAASCGKSNRYGRSLRH